jgi:hypothetical protein
MSETTAHRGGARFDSRWMLLCGVWESLGIRLPWAQEIVSSNLTTPIVLRWSSCWYEQAAVNRPDTGSIPVTAALRKGKPIGDGNRFEYGRA